MGGDRRWSETTEGSHGKSGKDEHYVGGDQCRLAERLRGLGITCRACLDGPLYHKPHTGGEGCYKHQVATGQLTSASRPCDLRKNLEGDDLQEPVATPAEATHSNDARKVGSRPLCEYVRFETEQRGVLLYEPSALDKWVGMSIHQDKVTGEYINNVTGWPLNEGDTDDYKRYIQRHNERRDTGRRADKLIALVGEKNPRVLAELRFYIANHPWKVAELLSSARRTYLQTKEGDTKANQKAQSSGATKRKQDDDAEAESG